MILSKYYKYSLDALYLVRQFFNHGVILIDPDLYMNDRINFTGNKRKALQEFFNHNGMVSTRLRALFVEYITKDSWFQLRIYNRFIDQYKRMHKEQLSKGNISEFAYMYGLYAINYKYPKEYDNADLTQPTCDPIHNLKRAAMENKLVNMSIYGYVLSALSYNMTILFKFNHNIDLEIDTLVDQLDAKKVDAKTGDPSLIELVMKERNILKKESLEHANKCKKYHRL